MQALSAWRQQRASTALLQAILKNKCTAELKPALLAALQILVKHHCKKIQGALSCSTSVPSAFF